jgi:hypothetical protein
MPRAQQQAHFGVPEIPLPTAHQDSASVFVFDADGNEVVYNTVNRLRPNQMKNFYHVKWVSAGRTWVASGREGQLACLL